MVCSLAWSLLLFPLGGALASAGGVYDESHHLANASVSASTDEVASADFGIALVGEELEAPNRKLLSLAASRASIAADDIGARAMFGNDAMTSACRGICNGHFGGWHLNVDHGHRAYITTGAVRWGPTTKRSYGAQQVTRQTVTNNLDYNVTQEVRVISGRASSVTMSRTNLVEMGAEISMDVGIPQEFLVSAKTSFKVSTSDTQTQSDEEVLTSWNTVQAKVLPKSSVCVSVEVRHETYNVDFEVPVCYDGWFRCQYEYRCNGHYYWFGTFRSKLSSSRCKTMRGKLVGNRYTAATAFTSPGACPRSEVEGQPPFMV